MKKDIIMKSAQEYLIRYLRDKKSPTKTVHPWRQDGIFRIQHSLRVLNYVNEIASCENIDDNALFLIKLAAVFHDIGSFDFSVHHALRSAEIASQWFDVNENFSLPPNDIKSILLMIREHSNKENRDENLGLNILKDADILDEIGIMSIMMATNRVDKESTFFYEYLEDKIIDFEIPYCDTALKLCHTQKSKDIMMSKKRYILSFLEQLQLEQRGNINSYELLK